MTDGSMYDILGVPKDASTETIRKAYKCAARKHHPDRGGDSKTMTQVNVAYAILSDHNRREHYDLHGQDKPRAPIEQEARSVLMRMMMSAIDLPENVDCLQWIGEQLATASQQSKQQMTQIAGRIKKLDKLGKAIVSEKDDAMFRDLFEEQRRSALANRERAEHQIEVLKIAKGILKHFKFMAEAQPGGTPQFFVFYTA